MIKSVKQKKIETEWQSSLLVCERSACRPRVQKVARQSRCGCASVQPTELWTVMRYLFLLFAAATFPTAGLQLVTSHVFGAYKYPPLPCEGPESAGSSEASDCLGRTIPLLGGGAGCPCF